MPRQRRSVADQPLVSERVDESTLPVCSPGRLMVADRVDSSVGARRHRTRDYGIRIFDEDFDANGGQTNV